MPSQYYLPDSYVDFKHGDEFDFAPIQKSAIFLKRRQPDENDYVTDGNLILKFLRGDWYLRAYIDEKQIFTVHPQIGQIPLLIKWRDNRVQVNFKRIAPQCPADDRNRFNAYFWENFWIDFDERESEKICHMDRAQPYRSIASEQEDGKIQMWIMSPNYAQWQERKGQKWKSHPDGQFDYVQTETGMVYRSVGNRALLIGEYVNNRYLQIASSFHFALRPYSFPDMFLPPWMPVGKPFLTYLFYLANSGIRKRTNSGPFAGPWGLRYRPDQSRPTTPTTPSNRASGLLNNQPVDISPEEFEKFGRYRKKKTAENRELRSNEGSGSETRFANHLAMQVNQRKATPLTASRSEPRARTAENAGLAHRHNVRDDEIAQLTSGLKRCECSRFKGKSLPSEYDDATDNESNDGDDPAVGDEPKFDQVD